MPGIATGLTVAIAAGFIDRALKKLATDKERSIHHICNMSITLAGRQATAQENEVRLEHGATATRLMPC